MPWFKIWSAEVKWTRQIRPKDLKQVMKYPGGRILARTRHISQIDHIPVIPLPLGLIELETGGSVWGGCVTSENARRVISGRFAGQNR